MSSFQIRPVLTALAVVWLFALVLGSLLPQRTKSTLGTTNPHSYAVRGDISFRHRAIHYAAFGSTTLLLLALTTKPHQRLVALLFTIGLGIAVELLQYAIYGSSFERTDAVDDAIAASAVYVLWHVVKRLLRRDSPVLINPPAK